MMWEGVDENGRPARITHMGNTEKPYYLSIQGGGGFFSNTDGSFRTLPGAKGECARYTGRKWTWKEVK